MWIIIAAIIIFIIYVCTSDAGTTSGTPHYPHLHCTVSQTGSYSSILNQLEQIVSLVAKQCCRDFRVYVAVKKINASTCAISFAIDEVTFKYWNITFGSEFSLINDDYVKFETKQATGFTTAEDVKRELLLQFNWSDISTSVTESTIYNRGVMANHPLVVFNFNANYNG